MEGPMMLQWECSFLAVVRNSLSTHETVLASRG